MQAGTKHKDKVLRCNKSPLHIQKQYWQEISWLQAILAIKMLKMTQKLLLAAVKGKAALLFITHVLPKSLRIDEAVHLSRDGARQ